MSQKEIKLPPYLNAAYEGDDLFTGDQVIELLAKQKQGEPVAWMDSDWHYQLHKKGMVVIHKDEGDVLIGEPQPLYTTPQQRTWVGLTDDEFEDIELGCRSTPFGKIEAMRMVEAKLKEKNT